MTTIVIKLSIFLRHTVRKKGCKLIIVTHDSRIKDLFKKDFFMNINKLSLVNVIRNPVDTSVSMILMSLGVAIISMMLLISNATKNQLESNLGGVDMVIGAKGSPIQVILSSIFHIDNPTGNISLPEVKK